MILFSAAIYIHDEQIPIIDETTILRGTANSPSTMSDRKCWTILGKRARNDIKINALGTELGTGIPGRGDAKPPCHHGLGSK